MLPRPVAALALALALALRGAQAQSDVTLKLDLQVFGLDFTGESESDAAGGGVRGGGGGSSFMTTMMDEQGNVLIIDSGTPNVLLLALTELVPIPQSYQNISIDAVTMNWASPTELAYAFDVALVDTPQHTAAGWLAADVMDPPEVSVPPSGRLPATPADFEITIPCKMEGKAQVSFTLNVCTDAAAEWDGNACTQGTAQETQFV